VIDLEVLFSKEFRKDFGKIKDKSLRLKITKAITRLERNPDLGKPLKRSLKGHRRLRVGPFRIIYRVDGEKIVMNLFEHRSVIYKAL